MTTAQMTKDTGMAETTPKAKRSRWAMPVLALALLAGGYWGVQRWQWSRSHVSTNNASVGGHVVPVIAKVGGFAAEVRVGENQHVAAGDTIVTLDEAELRQRVLQAEADVAVARAALGSAATAGAQPARVEQASRQRDALSAQIEAARANQVRLEKDLERIRGLADKQIVSGQQLDAALAGVAAARASVASLEEQRSAATAGVATAQGSVQESEARLRVAQAVLAGAQLQLAYAHVVAPVAGVVAKRSVEPGQLLQAGQPLLMIVADSGVFVNANFKETQLAHIRPGEPVEVEVDAYGGCPAKGEVQGISGATGSQFALIPTDGASGNFTKIVQRVPVRIRVTEGCGPERPLRPGMSVEVHVDTGGA